MISTDVDLSLRGCAPTPERLEDGFSPPPTTPDNDHADAPAESQLSAKSAF